MDGNIFLTVFSKITGPYWNVLRKDLAKKGISSLTITIAPNLFGHPVGIFLLLAFGLFALPKDLHFYGYWFAMISIAAIVSIFTIWGLIKTKFFGVQIIGSLGFVASSIFAFFILNEKISNIQTISLSLAIVGVIIFSWPKKKVNQITFDRGILFVILAVMLGGLASVFYKMASAYTENYASFLSGRFIGDLIGWTIAWLISAYFISKNPINETAKCIKDKTGIIFIAGIALTTLLDSWLIYKLPITTIAIIGTLVFPVSYFVSKFKYKEKISPKMWIGTALIIGAVILFLI